MQASLPKLVRMISVEDIGQGSESLRILGIKWLPAGAATQSVSSDGKLQSSKSQERSDRNVQGEGEIQDDETDDENQDKPGLQGESGDFVNVEVGFSYRARAESKNMKSRAKNAHLYLAFYLSGNVKFPVWVELRGLVGIMRLRLQLTPGQYACSSKCA